MQLQVMGLVWHDIRTSLGTMQGLFCCSTQTLEWTSFKKTQISLPKKLKTFFFVRLFRLRSSVGLRLSWLCFWCLWACITKIWLVYWFQITAISRVYIRSNYRFSFCVNILNMWRYILPVLFLKAYSTYTWYIYLENMLKFFISIHVYFVFLRLTMITHLQAMAKIEELKTQVRMAIKYI